MGVWVGFGVLGAHASSLGDAWGGGLGGAVWVRGWVGVGLEGELGVV